MRFTGLQYYRITGLQDYRITILRRKKMKIIKTTLTISLITIISQFVFAEEDNCFKYYVEIAKRSRNIALSLQYSKFGLTLGGTTAGLIIGAGGGIPGSSLGVVSGASVGSSEGASVGSTEIEYSTKADFVSNVAQTMIEAKADVVGPYSTQMANDLNDAIYDKGKFKSNYIYGAIRYESPLGKGVKIQLRNNLNERDISAKELSDATKFLLQNGGLCKIDGSILTQEDWAKLIVFTTQQNQ